MESRGKRTAAEMVKRVMMCLLGFLIIGFGIACMLVIDLGIDPFGAMNIGLASHTGISFGTWILICHLPVFVVMLWRGRRLIGVGTILGMFVVGYAIDFFSFLASLTFLTTWQPPLPLQLALLLVALIIFSVGIAMYMVADIGTVPYDSCGLMIEDATKGRLKFKWARVMMDGICAVAAFVLGAPLGIATILTVFCLGPFISFFRGKIGPFATRQIFVVK